MSKAERRGYEDGQAAGSWVFDGNTARQTFARILQGIEDGDPEVLDMLPSAPAGSSDAYALAFARGVEDEVTSAARYQLEDDDD